MTLSVSPPFRRGQGVGVRLGNFISPSLESNSISLSSGSDLFGQVTRARIKAKLLPG